MAGGLARAVHQHQRQKHHQRDYQCAYFPEHRLLMRSVPNHTGQRDQQQRKQQQIATAHAGAVGDLLPQLLPRTQQLIVNAAGGGPEVTVEQFLHSAQIHIGKKVRCVELFHQHQRTGGGSSRPDHRAAHRLTAGPGQYQREQPQHSVIGPHQRGGSAQRKQRRPDRARMPAPAADACGQAQHGQHQRVVQRLLHSGEHIPHRGIQRGDADAEQQLALPVQAGTPYKAEPTRQHPKQVAV